MTTDEDLLIEGDSGDGGDAGHWREARQRVLVVAADPEVRARITTAVISGGGVAVQHETPAPAGTAAETDPLPFRLLIHGSDGDERALHDLAARLPQGSQVISVVPPVELRRMARLLAQDACDHVITGDDAGMQWLGVTVGKFVSGDLFGIEKYLPAGTDVRLTRLRDYKGRTRAIDEVLDHAEKLGVRSKIRLQIGQVCEELLMNALYDAPVDEQGQVVFAEVDIKERLERLSPRPVSIRYAATDTTFSIAVRDRYGRLDKSTVVRYLEKCLNSGSQIDRKIYGAGLGLYLVMNAASHVAINIAPSMATEVVCSFDRKGVRTGLKAFSMFVYPADEAATEG